MLTWLFDPASSAQVGGLSFLVGLVGFALTVIGLRLTYNQAREAKSAAEQSTAAVEQFKFRLERYAASHDLSKAVTCIDSARRHLMNDAWRDVSDSYEEGRQALLRASVSDAIISEEPLTKIAEIVSHMASMVSRIDTVRSGKGAYPDKKKVLPIMRQNHDYILTLQKNVEKEL